MREILFRGKRRDNGEWVQGDFCDPCNIVFLENGYDAVLEKDDVPCCNDFEVIPETVGQYIGLSDKNGTKIFEGDILESRYDEKHPDDVCYEVVLWYNNGWCIQQEGYADPDHLDEDEMLKYSVVVGNIYDNPELVKGELDE